MPDIQQGAKPAQPATPPPPVNASRAAERRQLVKDIACAILTRGSRTAPGLVNEAVGLADALLERLDTK